MTLKVEDMTLKVRCAAAFGAISFPAIALFAAVGGRRCCCRSDDGGGGGTLIGASQRLR